MMMIMMIFLSLCVSFSDIAEHKQLLQEITDRMGERRDQIEKRFRVVHALLGMGS